MMQRPLDDPEHPRRENEPRDEIEMFIRDAYAAGCSAGRNPNGALVAFEYAHIHAPKLRALLPRSINPGSLVNNADIFASDTPHVVVKKLDAAFASSAPEPSTACLETWTDDELWQIVNEFDDRTSPEDYPEMIMLSEAEFRDFLERGRAALLADNAAQAARIKCLEDAIKAKGGNEHSPTQDSYDLACKAIEKHRERAQALKTKLAAATETAAQVAYRVCAETRHVTLGDKAAAAIRALSSPDHAEADTHEKALPSLKYR